MPDESGTLASLKGDLALKVLEAELLFQYDRMRGCYTIGFHNSGVFLLSSQSPQNRAKTDLIVTTRPVSVVPVLRE